MPYADPNDPRKKHSRKKASAKYHQRKRESKDYIARHMCNSARQRARKSGLVFDITINDIDIPAVCPVLGIPLFVGSGKLSRNSPTLDRIDSSKGYTRENIKVISHRANTIKSNATASEIYKVYEYMKSAEENHVDRH